MTKLLDEAIAKVRELPQDEQDAVADTLFAHLAGAGVRYGLTDEQAAEVLRARANLREGKTAPVPDAEMEAFWAKHRL